MEVDDLRKRKDMVLQNGRYDRQFVTTEAKLIGKGGFGTVSLVEDRLEEVFYAVKKVRLHLPKDGNFEHHVRNHRVFREVAALSKSSQQDMRNVVRYYNSWLEDLSPSERKEEKFKLEKYNTKREKRLSSINESDEVRSGDQSESARRMSDSSYGDEDDIGYDSFSDESSSAFETTTGALDSRQSIVRYSMKNQGYVSVNLFI
jgi:hypothetical protein